MSQPNRRSTAISFLFLGRMTAFCGPLAWKFETVAETCGPGSIVWICAFEICLLLRATVFVLGDHLWRYSSPRSDPRAGWPRRARVATREVSPSADAEGD